jgi:hypothetical protein
MLKLWIVLIFEAINLLRIVRFAKHLLEIREKKISNAASMLRKKLTINVLLNKALLHQHLVKKRLCSRKHFFESS